MKRVLSLLVAIVLSVSLLAACGGQKQNNTSTEVKPAGDAVTAPEKKDPVKISMYSMESVKAESFAQAVKAFNESQDEVILEVEVDAKNYWTNLKTKLAAGSPPDIFTHVSGTDLETYVDAGHLRDLTGESYLDKIYPYATEAAMYKGKVYGVSLEANLYGIYYNKGLFKKAGITEVPKTISQLSEAISKLKAIGVSPFVIGPKSGDAVGQIFYNGSSAIISPKAEEIKEKLNKKENAFDYPEMKNYFKVADLIRNNCQDRPMDYDIQGAVTYFATDKAGMMMSGNWAIALIRGVTPELDAGIFPIPVSENPQDAVFALDYRLLYNVSSKTANYDAVKKFLTFFLDAEGPAKVYYSASVIPSAVKGAVVKVDPIAQMAKETMDKDGKAVYFFVRHLITGFKQEADAIMQEFVIKKEIGIDETVEKLNKKWHEMYDKLQK